MERLNKYLAHAGIGSRRHCDDLIQSGRIRIDGQIVREMGTRIDPERHKVSVDDQPLEPERLVYWLVNKPRGYLCTNHDPEGRPRALDLIPHVNQRVYTVGRLDEDSEGLLLMTNDGDLAFKLMHPRFGITKTYLVQVAGKPTGEDLQQLLDGVYLSEGKVQARRIRRLKSQGDSTWLEIVLAEGKNREIRRLLARQKHKVMRLKRIAIGPMLLDKLRKGKSRRLGPEEVEMLRRSCVRRRPSEKATVEEPAAVTPRSPRPRTAPLDRPTSERPRRERPSSDRPRQEGSRQERPRQEGSRQERPRQERPSSDRPRQGRPSTDRPHQERSSSERPRQEGSRQGRPRQERPSSERPRPERPRQEGSRQERPRQERPLQGRPQEGSRQERPRQGRPSSDRPRQEKPRQERPRQDGSRQERPRQDKPRQGRPRPEGPRADRPPRRRRHS